MRSDDLYKLPEGLPVPVDDGACVHLTGAQLPDLELPATGGAPVSLAKLPGRTVVYAYPRTGEPDKDPPEGWDLIPGARGCTPQSCAFRDHHAELAGLHAGVYGLSTQDTAYQQEVVARLHLPFEILSDEAGELTRALKLPTFQISGVTLLKRFTLILNSGRIEKMSYPVFPPNENAAQVLAWLRENRPQA